MSWIYINRIGVFDGRPQQEGICETAADLTAAAGTNKADYNGSKIDFAPGSIAFVLETETVNIKKSDESWHSVGQETTQEAGT